MAQLLHCRRLRNANQKQVETSNMSGFVVGQANMKRSPMPPATRRRHGRVSMAEAQFMNSLRRILNRWIDKWLLPVVDSDQSPNKGFSFGGCSTSGLEFRVLTPAMQRRLDESA